MQITVNLMDLLLALLILVGVVVGIFLVVFLVRLIKSLNHLSKLSTDLHDPLTQTANQLPDLIRKIDSISMDVSALTKSANETVSAILVDAKTITGTARAGVEAVGSAAENISSGFSSFFRPAQERPDNVSSIIGIVSEVLQIVSLFTGHEKTKYHKPLNVHRKKRRRR